MEEAARHSVLPSLLRYEDRNSMAFSRESRLPFLTPELARFAAGVPRTELLGPDGRGKWLLREAMRGLVPDPILDRRDKVGFTTPESAWLHDCGPWLLSMLEADLAGVPALLAAPVLAVARDVAAGKAVAGPEVWRWLSLVRWARLFEVEWS
jgi:asparagine synthase (glutamine-hydrolysing)